MIGLKVGLLAAPVLGHERLADDHCERMFNIVLRDFAQLTHLSDWCSLHVAGDFEGLNLLGIDAYAGLPGIRPAQQKTVLVTKTKKLQEEKLRLWVREIRQIVGSIQKRLPVMESILARLRSDIGGIQNTHSQTDIRLSETEHQLIEFQKAVILLEEEDKSIRESVSRCQSNMNNMVEAWNGLTRHEKSSGTLASALPRLADTAFPRRFPGSFESNK